MTTVLPSNNPTYAGYHPSNYMSTAVGGKSKRKYKKNKSNKKCRSCRRKFTLKRKLNKLFINVPYHFAMK
jgi:hypothetical protein